MSKTASLRIGISTNGGQVMCLPASAYDDAMAILGRRGRGKTTTAAVLIEELHAVGRRFCILDPTGVWHGLRSSADGRHKGLPVVVMGGEHGDVPLEAGSGRVIADFVADPRNPSVVLDLSGFDDDGTERFVNDYLRHLYKINRHRLYQVFDECQHLAPESPDSPAAFKMKKAAAKVFQLGRAHGLLPILISPRPSSVAKDCLYACGMMIVHGITAPADQEALKKWVRNAGTQEQVEEFQPSLSKLPVGVAWVWSPDADVFERVHIRPRETFDSSKTAGGASRTPKVRADVDLKALTGAIASTIERARQDDPAALRAEVVRLRAELAAKPKEVASTPQVKEVRVEIPSLKKAQIKAILKMSRATINELHDTRQYVAKAFYRAEPLLAAVTSLIQLLEAPQSAPPAPRLLQKGDMVTDVHGRRAVVASAPRVDVRRSVEDPQLKVGKSELKVLDAIAWFLCLGNETPSKVAVAFKAGYTAGTGRFNNLLGSLRTQGLVEYAGDGVRLVPGSGALQLAAAPPTAIDPADLHRSVLDVLPQSEGKLMRALLDDGKLLDGRNRLELPLDVLASATGYTPGTGRFNNLVGRLRTLGLAENGSAKGTVRAAACLFPG